MSALSNAATQRGELNPPSVRFTPEAFPEAKSSKTGVSVKYVFDPNKKWYVFRASYGNNNTSSYLTEQKTERFICTARTYLRIHQEPYLQSPVVGKIPNAQYVSVYPNNTYDDFIKVQCGNIEG